MARWEARRGFTLVEAAVAVAVTAILAGMMAPLALKALNQRREASTRKSLKLVFEALFGARDRRVANMRADLGFDPPEGNHTLRLMVEYGYNQNGQLHVGLAPPFGRNPRAEFRWGWNGPYWHGDLKGRLPVDAWGRPIQLRVHNQAVQVYSHGHTGREGQDNLVYPPVPVPLDSLKACLNIHVTVNSRDLNNIRLAVKYGGNDALTHKMTPPSLLGAGRPATHTVCVPAGGMEVVALGWRQEGPDLPVFSLPLDLLPGETRDVWVNL